MRYSLPMRGFMLCLVLSLSTVARYEVCYASSSEDVDWEIRVAANKDVHGEWQLDIVMDYHGDKTVEIPNREIPWKWPYSMIFCLVPEREFAVRPRHPKTLASEPPQGHVTVKPGDTLKGVIPLRSLFDQPYPGWLEGSMIVFWSYKPQASKRVGGWLEIPCESRSENKDDSNGEEWKLAVSVEKDGSIDCRLNFAIGYHGKKETYVKPHLLPWKWPEALIVCGVYANGQRPDPFGMAQTGDPPKTLIWVKPGEVIRGDFAPARHFYKHIETFRRGPVIVFWSYKIKSSNRVGGWFEVDETEKSRQTKGGITD